MIDFFCNDSFSSLYLKTRTKAYIDSYVSKTVDKLIHLFTNLGIHNIQVLYQKSPVNSVSALIAKAFNKKFV